MLKKYKVEKETDFVINLSKYDVLKYILKQYLSKFFNELDNINNQELISQKTILLDELIKDNKDDYLEFEIADKYYFLLNVYKFDYFDNLITYSKEILGITVKEDEESTEKLNNIKKNVSLNQIFFGPPGTGKTYNVVNESLKILGEDSSNLSNVEKFDKLYSLNPKLLNDDKLKPGKKIYRNLSYPISTILKIFDKNNTVSMTKEEIIESAMNDYHLSWSGPSTISQNTRPLLHFNLLEKNNNSFELTDKGKEFLSEYKTINFSNEMITSLKNYIVSSLRNTTLNDINLVKNMILCTLRWFYEDKIISDASNTIKLLKYYNYENMSYGYIFPYLMELNLIEKKDTNFSITNYGEELVESLTILKDIDDGKENKQIKFNRLNEIGKIEFVTFHQSFSYEEFIEGIRPEVVKTSDGKNEITYNVKNGIFKNISNAAIKNPDENFVLIIDEINRGNISNIFGELITLLENTKRKGNKDALSIKLPYSNEIFSVPNNLYVIATMNTVDRSIGLIDNALRRRFTFIEYPPLSKLITSIDGIDLIEFFTTLNKRISFLLDDNHKLGHAYFMSIKNEKDLNILLKDKIIPLLQEYFYDEWDKIALVFADNDAWGKKEEEKIIQKNSATDVNELFGESDLNGYEDKIVYQVNENLLKANLSLDILKLIYEKPTR
ncbi:hypothetical protein CRV01_00905 [Arcobacter sp. CECT 8983]|uniref:AAA family ATPase n=1 Tax=Arcobacter sp. CECT 8983 TaxID=2044508 RepID=UPI0010262305|nr:AAA family ATPase [Arcobacter sp. CECT 8983]RXJ91683.1 hypothetical protein CRV01_00905 [Arcobacter sp. CECT 8983]